MVFHTFLTKLKVKVAINRYENSPNVNGFFLYIINCSLSKHTNKR